MERASASLPLTLCGAAVCLACGPSAETHHISPQIVGMTDGVAPIYDDGELVLYEVREPISLPVLRPTDGDRRALRAAAVPPFPRGPWVERRDLKVQISWVLTNLDGAMHDVEILIDPWNEFGRYWPGFTVVDQQNGDELPNLSGIDIRRQLPGLRNKRGDSSRVTGTFTFDDLDELAADFATVQYIIDEVSPPPADAGDGDPRIEWVNHTFDVHNRQGRTPLTDRYRPSVVPAVTGFDLGLRTTEPANIAIEITVELVDETGERVRPDDSSEPILRPPDRYYTIGSG